MRKLTPIFTVAKLMRYSDGNALLLKQHVGGAVKTIVDSGQVLLSNDAHGHSDSHTCNYSGSV
jgi:hypothetical protein